MLLILISLEVARVLAMELLFALEICASQEDILT